MYIVGTPPPFLKGVVEPFGKRQKGRGKRKMPYKGRGRKEGRSRVFKGGVEIVCYETTGKVIKLTAFIWFYLKIYQLLLIINGFITAQPWERAFLSTKSDPTPDFAIF